jgi:hypothetical protein
MSFCESVGDIVVLLATGELVTGGAVVTSTDLMVLVKAVGMRGRAWARWIEVVPRKMVMIVYFILVVIKSLSQLLDGEKLLAKKKNIRTHTAVLYTKAIAFHKYREIQRFMPLPHSGGPRQF